MITEKLCWQIDGEWLTNLVRKWFWDEDKPYESCKELISSCVQSDDDTILTTITNEILEGRKKFVGINEFEYVDDNERVRSISLKISELEKKNAISRIELDIVARGIDYVDPYSTVKSIKEAKRENITTANDCSIYFQYSNKDQISVRNGEFAECLPAVETPTGAGLWLFTEPEIIYEATKQGKYAVGSEMFWENVYHITQGREGFESRNEKYLAMCRIENKEYNPKPETFNRIGDDKKPIPDPSLSSWSGLLSPKGDFYPADFGCHEHTAYRILSEYGEKMGESVHIYDNGHKAWNGCIDNALQVLLQKGWIRFSYLNRFYIEDCTTYSSVDCRWKPTQIQKDIVWEQIVRHNVSSSILSEIYY